MHDYISTLNTLKDQNIKVVYLDQLSEHMHLDEGTVENELKQYLTDPHVSISVSGLLHSLQDAPAPLKTFYADRRKIMNVIMSLERGQHESIYRRWSRRRSEHRSTVTQAQ